VNGCKNALKIKAFSYDNGTCMGYSEVMVRRPYVLFKILFENI
jgi:hypothetical protein